MNELTEKILKHDSLHESEKLLGKNHYSEFNGLEQTFSIVKFMEDNQVKKDYLQSIGDTYWCIPWNDFISVIERYGFKRAWSQIFVDTSENETNKNEEEIIYYHKEKGLVLWAESYTLCNKKQISSGTVFSIADFEGIDDWWKYREGSSGVYDGFLQMDFDIREGVIHKIEKISNLKLLNKWNTKQKYMDFVNFVESKEIYKSDKTDYKVTGKMRNEITQKKIEMCPEEFKDIINGFSYISE